MEQCRSVARMFSEDATVRGAFGMLLASASVCSRFVRSCAWAVGGKTQKILYRSSYAYGGVVRFKSSIGPRCDGLPAPTSRCEFYVDVQWNVRLLLLVVAVTISSS